MDKLQGRDMILTALAAFLAGGIVGFFVMHYLAYLKQKRLILFWMKVIESSEKVEDQEIQQQMVALRIATHQLGYTLGIFEKTELDDWE